MGYKCFFTMSAGISKTIIVPKGTIADALERIEEVENTLGIKREKFLKNPTRWAWNNYKDIPDEVLCKVAEKHNDWVRSFYNTLERYSVDAFFIGEKLTPKIFSKILVGLNFIEVPPERWTGDYYTERMKTLYEVMRGRECEGISFDTKPLTEKQAANVILLFSEFLDHHDRRLDVPKGRDYLASSYNGGYDWCEKCGAITYEDAQNCETKKCPLLKEYEEERIGDE